MSSSTSVYDVLEDRSIFDGGGSVFTLEFEFELCSRLSHQPILLDFLRPLLI